MKKEEEFINKIKDIYLDKSEEIIELQYKEPLKTFRVNTLKASKDTVLLRLKQEGFKIISSKLDNSFIVLPSENLKKISESNEYLANEIYIQELSSMLPVIALEAKENDNILDLCAAPGSKTTQLAVQMNNKINIVAVEKARNRFFKMREIIQNQGVENIKTILEDANYLPIKYKEFNKHFDKVLLDVPCSNEASIDLSHPSTLKYWSKNEAKHISKLQKGLINTAIKMLCPGGTLVYSTCTYSVEENELVLDWILSRNTSLKVEKINLNLKNIMPGIISWKGKPLNKQISNSIRVLPDGYFKGFFLAKIKYLNR